MIPFISFSAKNRFGECTANSLCNCPYLAWRIQVGVFYSDIIRSGMQSSNLNETVVVVLVLQYPPRQRGHPPILQLKSHFLHVYSLMTVHSNLIMNISAKSYCFSLAISLFRIFRFAFIMKL